MRLKWPNDLIAVRSGGGAVLRRDHRMCTLRQAAAYELLSLLRPSLNGTVPVEELVQALDPQAGGLVRQLLTDLADTGMLERISDSDAPRIDGTFVSCFRSQLEFLDHVAGQAARRFTQYRNARILLCGWGVSLDVCAAELLRHGLADLFVVAARESDAGLPRATQALASLRLSGAEAAIHTVEQADSGAALARCQIAVFCSDSLDPHAVHALAAECARHQVDLLVGAAVGRTNLIGPLVSGYRPACWLCGLFRIAEDAGIGSSELEACASAGHNSGASDGAASLGTSLGFELFKLLSGSGRAQVHDTIRVERNEGPDSFDCRAIHAPLLGCVTLCRKVLREARASTSC